ncbi:MAG: hypothetical protein WD029_01825, partial [Microthrixaceae bacterium]
MAKNLNPASPTKLLRRSALLATAALALVWAVEPFVAQAQTSTPEPVEFLIYNTHEALAPTLSWVNLIKSSPLQPDMSQIARGDSQSKFQLIIGGADAVVSGTPFTAEELAELEKTGRSVIAAPVQAVGMSMLASGPQPYGIDLCSFQVVPDQPDPDFKECLKVRDFEGPLRFTSEDIADVFLESSQNNWQNQGFLDLLKELVPVGELSMFSPVTPAATVLRSDEGMANLSIGQYIKATQPQKWSAKFASLSQPETAPSTIWPFFAAPKKPNMPDAVGVIRQWKTASAAVDVPAESGAMTLSTPLAASQAIQAESEEPPFDGNGFANIQTDLYFVQLQNGAGEWLTATPESITTALAANTGNPLPGLTQAIPGAWPLSWVNSLYVPDSGLTGDQANAIAAIIRWQATVGRSRAAELLDGQLPAPLAIQALDAADEVVRSNCKAAGLSTITTSDPSKFAPAGTLSDLGEIVWCATPASNSVIDLPVGPTSTDPISGAVLSSRGTLGSLTGSGAARSLDAIGSASGSTTSGT